eukprot:jgi/Botrbrau1/7021/Bobra.0165s0047.1
MPRCLGYLLLLQAQLPACSRQNRVLVTPTLNPGYESSEVGDIRLISIVGCLLLWQKSLGSVLAQQQKPLQVATWPVYGFKSCWCLSRATSFIDSYFFPSSHPFSTTAFTRHILICSPVPPGSSPLTRHAFACFLPTNNFPQ